MGRRRTDRTPPPSRRGSAATPGEVRAVIWIATLVLLWAVIFAGFGGVRGARVFGLVLGAVLFAIGMSSEAWAWRHARRARIRRRRARPETARRLRDVARANRTGPRPRPPAVRRTISHRARIRGQPAFEMEDFGRDLLILVISAVLLSLALLLGTYIAR
ncbi:MAG: hypothetical protein QNJ98_06310 [Planctomycetota bacterium]|nr:hypothetical protein [Planctomycetota bacterium]